MRCKCRLHEGDQIRRRKKYGFIFDKEDLYTLRETRLVKVDTAISNLTLFAKEFGMNYKELKIHNPAPRVFCVACFTRSRTQLVFRSRANISTRTDSIKATA